MGGCHDSTIQLEKNEMLTKIDDDVNITDSQILVILLSREAEGLALRSLGNRQSGANSSKAVRLRDERGD